MARRYYSSTAARTTLATGVDDTTTTLSVTAVSGWPSSFPYTLIIDADTVNEEIVEVSARSGTTLTVTRGVDGTSAVAHSSGAAVQHGVSARDFDEPNAFINGTGTVTETLLASGAVTEAKLASNAVTSAKILDGTIVNADINASAAIAQSKIANLTSDLASKRANLTPYTSTSSNRTLANTDMQRIWGLVGALTITLPASGVIDTNSTVTLWAFNNTVTISVPSGITVVGTPSGTVGGSGSFTISSGTVANLFLYDSTTWLYSAGGGTVAANFTDAATGTYTDGSGVEWKYKDYSASSTLTIDRAGLVECLIVAGGGGGGGAPVSGSYGGGGGAGGLLGFGTFTNANSGALYLPAATYTVTVGSGGAGGTTAPTGGSFGTDSRLGNIYAHRGAPGTPGSANNLLKGGSGGGGASAGSGIPGQGNNGAGLSAGQAGGGGGAGGAASGATEGAGLAIDITGSSVTYGSGGSSTVTFTGPTIGGGGDGYAGYNVAGQTGGNGRVVVRVRIN